MDLNIKRKINIRAKKDLAHTDFITGDQFEIYMTYILNHTGYHHVIHTPYSNDHGVDAYSKVDSISWQFKDYDISHKVSFHAVEEVMLGAAVYNTKYNVVLTNSYFSKDTIKNVLRANKNYYKGYITLINRYNLLGLFKIYEKLKIERSARYQEQKKRANKKREIEYKGYYLANNTLEDNITNSESIHNFNSRVKQFAYYTLRILPKYHMTLNALTKAINSGTEILHPLSDGCFYDTLIVDITYPIAINQLHNYTKQRLIFVYYPLKYIRRIYPNYPTLDLHLSDNSSQSDIITIISNIKYKNVISNDIKMVGNQEPIDSNANLYKQNQFSINANTCHMFHTLINFDDIRTLSDSLKLYHNLNSKHEIQSNINYLNKFYSDRKKLLPEIEAMNKVREENKELRKATHKLQIHNIIKNNSKKYHQLNNVIETDIDKSKDIYDFNSRPKQFAFCTLLLLSKYDVNKYIDNINRATMKKAYNWDANDSKKFGNQSNKSYYYLVLNIKHDNSFQRILFIYYSPEMMRTEYKNSFPYQSLYRKALNESVYFAKNSNISFSINEYTFISNLLFNPRHSVSIIRPLYRGRINQYQLKQGNMSVAINDIKSLFQGHNVYKNRQKQIKIEKVHEAKVRAKDVQRKAIYQSQIRTEAIKNSKKYRQLNSIIERDIDKSKTIHDFGSRTKQFAFCILMQSVIYHPYTNNLIKVISKATVKQSTNQDNGHGENENDFPLGLQRDKAFHYLELHVDNSIYNGTYNDNLYFVYYAPNEYKYGYPYQDIHGTNVIDGTHTYDDEFDDDFSSYDEYSFTIISNYVFNQQRSKSKRLNIGFQGNGQVIQYTTMSDTYVDDIKTLVQSSNIHNNYYTKLQQRMSPHNKYLVNEREQPMTFKDNSFSLPLLLDRFNIRKYRADKHREQINHKDFEDKLQHLNPHDRQVTLDQIRDIQKSRERVQHMYEDAQHIRQGIHTLGQQSLRQGIKLGSKGAKWIKNFVNQHMQTKPYTNTGYNTVPSQSLKTCPNCHAKVNKSSNFCIYCGHHFMN